VTVPVATLLQQQVFRGMVVAGVVIDNNDPKKLLRVRVRVRELHREVEDEDLPWCMPMNLGGGMGMNGRVGSINVPVNGTRVLISYLDDSQYYPVYTSWRVDETSIPEELKADYPDVYGMIDAAGNLFTVNTKTKVVKFHHSSGTKFEIAANGGVNLTAAQSVTVGGHGDINVLGTGKVTVVGAGNIDMRGPRIDMNKSTSGPQPTAVTVRPAPAAVTLPNKDY